MVLVLEDSLDYIKEKRNVTGRLTIVEPVIQ